MNCTSKIINSLLSLKEKKEFIKENCSYNYINFYYIYYCLLNSSIIPSIILALISLIVLFFILSSTSDLFLSTAMVKLIETYNINQNVAAVTLISFGNSAPDIISSLVASEDDNIYFSLGSMMGSGMFITCFVLGLIVFKGKDILVNSFIFNKDLLLYLISLGIIIIIGIKKSVNLADSLVFISIYVLNVFLAFFRGKKEQKKDDEENKALNEEDKDQDKNMDRNNDIKDINSLESTMKSNYKQIELTSKNPNIDKFYNEYLNSKVDQDILNKQIFGEIKEDINKEQEAIIEIEKAYSQLK